MTSNITDTELVNLRRLISELALSLSSHEKVIEPRSMQTLSDVLRSYCSGVNVEEAHAFLEQRKTRIVERPVIYIYAAIDYILFERKDWVHSNEVFQLVRETNRVRPFSFDTVDSELDKLYGRIFDFIKVKRNSQLSEQEKRERIRELINQLDSENVSSEFPKFVRAVLKVRAGLNDLSEIEEYVKRSRSRGQVIADEVAEGYNIPEEVLSIGADEVDSYYREVARILLSGVMTSSERMKASAYAKDSQEQTNRKFSNLADKPPGWLKASAYLVGGAIILISAGATYISSSPLAAGTVGYLVAAVIIIATALAQTFNSHAVYTFYAYLRYGLPRRHWDSEVRRLRVDVSVPSVLFREPESVESTS
jgi:hypothetical protein